MDARHVLGGMCLAACSLGAGAQDIYRCGNAYSQKPCEQGVVVQADDARSAQQRAEAQEVARRDARVADEMQARRLKLEAQPVQAYIPQPAAKDKNDEKPGNKRARKTKTVKKKALPSLKQPAASAAGTSARASRGPLPGPG